MRLLLTATFAFALLACADHAAPPPSDPSTHGAPVIYGTDDRIEVPDASPAAQLAARSVVVLVYPESLSANPDGTWDVDLSSTFGASRLLCDSEPFRDQPDPGWCSGVQIGSDLIATAGHCVEAATCSDTMFVFDWGLAIDGGVKATVGGDDVYRCASIVGRMKSASDWAIVRVDRPIVGRLPLPVRGAGKIANGAPVAVIGHPFGIPAKVAGNAEVKDNTPAEYFRANLDTYAGNSGSPVFDATFTTVEGLLVRGNADLVMVGKGKNRCYTSNVCSDAGCPGWEDVTRATEFAHLVSAEPPPPCTDDVYEDNDDDAQATLVAAPTTLDDLQICAGDPDWFRAFVEAGEVLTATAAFDPAAGELVVELRDLLGGLMATSVATLDGASVSHAPRAFSGTVYVVVKGVGPAQNAYTLSLALATPPPPTQSCGDGVCDPGESCDGRAGSVVCPSDCPGRTSGKPQERYCWVGGACEGPGC